MKFYWHKNKERIRNRHKKLMLENPEYANHYKEKTKNYYLKNRERLLPKFRKRNKNFRIKHRESVIFSSINSRCNNPKQPGFPYYGGRGIKNLLTKEQIKFIWERDNASLMEKPSIDRVDSDGNYELSNCRFIELSENVRRANKFTGFGWIKEGIKPDVELELKNKYGEFLKSLKLINCYITLRKEIQENYLTDVY